jgi:multisubunit Na+/H+ antiporter MnhB subunit
MSNNVIIYLNQKIFIWGESLFHQVLLVLFVKAIHLLAFQIIQIEHALIQMANVTNVIVIEARNVDTIGSGLIHLIQVT